jgi:hypothetical protein
MQKLCQIYSEIKCKLNLSNWVFIFPIKISWQTVTEKLNANGIKLPLKRICTVALRNVKTLKGAKRQNLEPVFLHSVNPSG